MLVEVDADDEERRILMTSWEDNKSEIWVCGGGCAK